MPFESVFLVVSRVNVSDSRGMLVTNGPMSQPSAEGNVACQRHRLALHVHAAVALDEVPVRIESPEVSPVAADWFLALVRSPGILDLLNPCADDAGRGMRGSPACESRCVVAVDDDRDALLLVEAEEDPEVVAVPRDDPRALHGRCEHVGVAVVVLEQAHGLRTRRVGDEHGSNPVMNQAIRHRDVPTSVARLEPLDDQSAGPQFGEQFAPAGVRKAVDPQGRRGCGRPDLGDSHIPVERGDGRGLQVGRFGLMTGGQREAHRQHEETACSSHRARVRAPLARRVP